MSTLNVEIPESLLVQQTTLANKLTEIAAQQAELTGQQHEVEASLQRISRAIAFLRGEVIPAEKSAGGRRAMSPEGRANIAAGLRAAHERKVAAQAAPQPTPPPSEPVVVPVVADPTPAAPKAARARK
jgi:hypothetical protein